MVVDSVHELTGNAEHGWEYTLECFAADPEANVTTHGSERLSGTPGQTKRYLRYCPRPTAGEALRRSTAALAQVLGSPPRRLCGELCPRAMQVHNGRLAPRGVLQAGLPPLASPPLCSRLGTAPGRLLRLQQCGPNAGEG